VPVRKEVNKRFFKTWTPEMAYVLGFFAADGNISVNSRGGNYFSLQTKDRRLLEEMRRAMGSKHKVSRRLQKRDNCVFYRMQIGSKELCEDLRAHGFFEKKARRMQLPPIPRKYFAHFLRGYFDGDGNVWVGFVHKERKKQTLVIHTAFTSASHGFLDALWENLKCFGVHGGSLSRKKDKEAHSLKFSINDSILLYHLMYDNLKDTLFLKRKKDRFDVFLRTRNR